jgi:hypothetical protein
MQYVINCFVDKTDKSYYGKEFPANTYKVDTIEEVTKIISNCTNKISGIETVEVIIKK